MDKDIREYFTGKVVFNSGVGMFFIQDDPKYGDKHFADIRGWGNIQNLYKKEDGSLDEDKAAAFQDRLGNFVAEAINKELSESHFSNVMRSLQEKKKLYEAIYSSAKSRRKSCSAKGQETAYIVNENSIDLYAQFVKTLEEIIDQNFA